ncbi:MAG: hypothetical protein WD646_07815 [Actinomycetota bacterium]
MTEATGEPGPADDIGAEDDRASIAGGMPRWVKVFLIVAAILAAILIIGLLTGQVGPGGGHGPGRHVGIGLLPV